MEELYQRRRRSLGKIFRQPLHHFPPRQSAAENQSIRFLQNNNLIRRESVPLKSDQIQSHHVAGHSINGHKRRHIAHHSCMTANHCHPPNSAKLVNRNASRKKRSIVDRHMTTQQTVVGQDHIASHSTIVRHMRTRHKVVSVPHHRRRFRFERPMHRRKFADRVALSDLYRSRLFRAVHMLRQSRQSPRSRKSYYSGPVGSRFLRPHGPPTGSHLQSPRRPRQWRTAQCVHRGRFELAD